jgi:hypothetical protein
LPDQGLQDQGLGRQRLIATAPSGNASQIARGAGTSREHAPPVEIRP